MRMLCSICVSERCQCRCLDVLTMQYAKLLFVVVDCYVYTWETSIQGMKKLKKDNLEKKSGNIDCDDSELVRVPFLT